MSDIKNIVLEDNKYPKYAWPGGYPIYYLAKDNDVPYAGYLVICPDCLNKEKEEMGIEVSEFDINYEDNFLYCDFCNEQIEATYSD
jgi:hypothetical protein